MHNTKNTHNTPQYIVQQLTKQQYQPLYIVYKNYKKVYRQGAILTQKAFTKYNKSAIIILKIKQGRKTKLSAIDEKKVKRSFL